MNKEKYNDPTAEQAIAHVMKEYREKKKGGDSPCQRQKMRERTKPLNYTGRG